MIVRDVILRTAAAAALTIPLAVNATSVSYYLDQNNIDPLTGTPLTDGINYLMVTIDDEGAYGDINFTVETLSVLDGIAGSNYGIQGFSFNTQLLTSIYDENTNITNLATNWSANLAPPPNNENGFGTFDIAVNDGGQNRLDTLTFSIAGIAGDDVFTYFEDQLTNTGGVPSEGNTAFTARVAGFDDGHGNTSAFFAGLTPVPLPPAFLLLASALGGLAWFRKKR
ncbi:MAG: hypothetical protein PVF34_03195 [Gammaproteobacteria bacterium]|jgi:hypothetical protein